MDRKKRTELNALVYKLRYLEEKELRLVLTTVLESLPPDESVSLLHKLISKQTTYLYAKEEREVRAKMENSFTNNLVLNRLGLGSGVDWSEVANHLREAGAAVLKAKKVVDGSI